MYGSIRLHERCTSELGGYPPSTALQGIHYLEHACLKLFGPDRFWQGALLACRGMCHKLGPEGNSAQRSGEHGHEDALRNNLVPSGRHGYLLECRKRARECLLVKEASNREDSHNLGQFKTFPQQTLHGAFFLPIFPSFRPSRHRTQFAPGPADSGASACSHTTHLGISGRQQSPGGNVQHDGSELSPDTCQSLAANILSQHYCVYLYSATRQRGSGTENQANELLVVTF